MAGFKSEWWPVIDRNAGRLHVGIRIGVRHYGDDDLRRLKFIRQAQTAGFTLEEIKELMDLDAGDDHEAARKLAKVRLKALEDRIAELDQARVALKRLIRECASGKTGPCPILSSFGV